MSEYRTYTKTTHAYGSEAFQIGDLYLPVRETLNDLERKGKREIKPLPMVCLLHGGFWKMPYDHEQFTAVAIDLVGRGYAVWNMGYRRVGSTGGGYPGTFNDVVDAVNYLEELHKITSRLDLQQVIVAGHSAGGHLALWLGGQATARSSLFKTVRVVPKAVIGLAPVADLETAFEQGAGDHAVRALMGGSPSEFAGLYRVSSPRAMLPLKVQQLVIHGILDVALPIEWTKSYVETARTLGDLVDYEVIPTGTHMDFVDPNSECHEVLCQWLKAFAI